MNVRLVPARRLPKGQWLPLAALALWGVLVWSAVQVSRQAAAPVGLCRFKSLTGVPCPTCGSTRAVLRASDGDVGAAFLSNPLVFVGLIWLTVVVGLRFVAGRRFDFGLTQRQRAWGWFALGGALLLNWVYVILFVG